MLHTRPVSLPCFCEQIHKIIKQNTPITRNISDNKIDNNDGKSIVLNGQLGMKLGEWNEKPPRRAKAAGHSSHQMLNQLPPDHKKNGKCHPQDPGQRIGASLQTTTRPRMQTGSQCQSMESNF